MLNVFLSYAREDFDEVNSVFNMLESHGFRPWMDKRRLLPGQNWEQEIVKSIQGSDAFIVFFSSNSAGKRGVFQKELKLALQQLDYLLENDIYILPVVLDDCEVPGKFRQFQWVEKSSPKYIQQLLNSLGLVARQRGKFSDQGFLVEYETKEEEYPSLKVDYTFPQLRTERPDNRADQVNSIISGQINTSIYSAKSLYRPRDELGLSGQKSELHCTSRVVLLTENFLSIYFRYYTYGSGAAHGNHHANTVNIDIKDGMSFILNDIIDDTRIFIDDCIEAIDAKYGLKHALYPEREHLTEAIQASMEGRCKINRTGVCLHFDPYEVFAYAAGMIEVEFTWDQLRSYGLSSIGRRIIYDLTED